jgi:DNA topoisomerase VI subunit B
VTELASKGLWVQKPHRKRTKKLFKLAGKVREDQLNQVLIKDIPECYCKALSESEVYHIGQLKMFLADYDLNVLEKLNENMLSTIDSIPIKHILRAIEELYGFETEGVLTYLKKLPERVWLHKIRIHLKNIQYTENLAEKNNQSLVRESFMRKIKEIADALGEWHDYESLLSSMESYEMNNPEHSIVSLIESEESIQKEREMAVFSELAECIDLFADKNKG